MVANSCPNNCQYNKHDNSDNSKLLCSHKSHNKFFNQLKKKTEDMRSLQRIIESHGLSIFLVSWEFQQMSLLSFKIDLKSKWIQNG